METNQQENREITKRNQGKQQSQKFLQIICIHQHFYEAK